MTYDDVRESLSAKLDKLGTDELIVLCQIADRLVLGRAEYGDLNIANDKRDWMVELEQEVLDGLVYGALQLIKRKRNL